MRGFDKVTLAEYGDNFLCVAVATDGTAWMRWTDFRRGYETPWSDSSKWSQLPALPQRATKRKNDPHHELAAEILRKLDAGEITGEQACEYSYEVGDEGVEASLWRELGRRRAVAALAKLRGEAKP